MSTELATSATAGAEVSIDDFMSSFITDIHAPTSPEDDFYNHMMGGKLPKIANLVYYLQFSLQLYDRMNKHGLCIADQFQHKRVPLRQIAKIMCEHYFMMHYRHWFVAGELPGRGAADMEKVVTRFLEVDSVKKVVFAENRT